MRDKYEVKEIKAIDPATIVKKFRLKGFVFGNYVTQEERYFFLFKIEKQLEILAKIKGSNNLGADVLTIGFGADGRAKANAHYNPRDQYINLARGRKTDFREILKGENSFVHEYGHFLDFVQGNSDMTTNVNFASKTVNAGEYVMGLGEIKESKKLSTRHFAQFVKIALDNEPYMERLNSPYLSSVVEVYARLFEATVTQIVREKYKSYDRFFDRSYASFQYLSSKNIAKSNARALVSKMLKGK